MTVSSCSQYFICENYLKLELQLTTPEKICACFFFLVSCLRGGYNLQLLLIKFST